MDISEAKIYGKQVLRENNVESLESSTEFLLRKVLRLSKTEMEIRSSQILTTGQEKKFRAWIKRRSKHEPIWYITGEIEFYGQDFVVNENVLIPRPETELLLEIILGKEQKYCSKILDVGTGSGAIILTLAKHLNGSFFASDFSEAALETATKNAKELNAEVIFKQGDLLYPWKDQRFDLVAANLPYVPHEDISTLALDLIHYEPRIALDGGEQGIAVYRRFFKELPGILNEKAFVYCEIGEGQGELLKKIAVNSLPGASVRICKDYSGYDRFLIIEK